MRLCKSDISYRKMYEEEGYIEEGYDPKYFSKKDANERMKEYLDDYR